MAQHPKEEKKLDFSSLPRGAISIKGLPVSRNTRLPSIRTPRDLTLGASSKRTFMPNIPVRREKKPQVTEDSPTVKQENIKIEKKCSPQLNDRGRGRGRGRAQIIQTEGAIFSEGIAADSSSKRERMHGTYHRSDYSSSSKAVNIKKEKADECSDDIENNVQIMNQLMRDNFIDDGDDDDEESLLKPAIFPVPADVKKEVSEVKEPASNFDPDIAKAMDFDINKVAKFIKKEKESENEEIDSSLSAEIPSGPSSNIINLFNKDTNSSKLVLVQFPQFINFDKKMDDAETSHKKSTNADSKISDGQNNSSDLIKSLPEGYIGKLQVLKSGETRLLIGSLEFKLDSINTLATKLEVASVKINSDKGDLSILGHVQENLKFVPNEDCFIKQ